MRPRVSQNRTRTVSANRIEVSPAERQLSREPDPVAGATNKRHLTNGMRDARFPRPSSTTLSACRCLGRPTGLALVMHNGRRWRFQKRKLQALPHQALAG